MSSEKEAGPASCRQQPGGEHAEAEIGVLATLKAPAMHSKGRLCKLEAHCILWCLSIATCRRAKQVLLTEAIEALRKKVKKGKGVSKEVIAERNEKVGLPSGA